MARQLELFQTPARPAGSPVPDALFTALERIELGDGAWLDHQPGWLAADAALFDQLEREAPWFSEERVMYQRRVATPRRLAALPPAARPPAVETMRGLLDARYGERFVRVTAALYRDGRDSVAFHGDTTARDRPLAIVATVSLGAPRRFLLRPAAGGASRALQLGRGDLLVMGGTCQRTFRHAVPKVASAEPRIALMFRPVWD